MTIQHTKVLSGEGWYTIASRLCPKGITTTQRNTFTTKLLAANGANLKTAVYAGQVLHYDTADLPEAPTPPPPPPPATRQVKPVPFNDTSPWNKSITSAEQTKWFDVPVLHNIPTGAQRNWYAGEGQLTVWHGASTDPVWTISMPEFGNNDARFNRHWLAATFTMHAPQNINQGTDADRILALIDETTGDYVECWNGVVIDPIGHTITGGAGQTGWARGNVDTGPGVGGLLSEGGNSAGVRAANFSWIAGAITGYDVDQVKTGKKTDFGHALNVCLTEDTLSTWGVTPPATAPNNAWNNGPIKMGSRIGIPASVTKPAGITDLLGIAYWNTLQRYGAFVGDFVGGQWPIFSVDIGSCPSGTLHSMWVWWDYPTCANVQIIPHLRVME